MKTCLIRKSLCMWKVNISYVPTLMASPSMRASEKATKIRVSGLNMEG